MWPDDDARISELLDKAKYFERAEYPGTAEWLRQLADTLPQTRDLAKLQREFDEVEKNFRSEFERGDPSRILLFSIVRTVLLAALSSSDKQERTLELMPLFEEAAQNSQNIAPIIEAFAQFVREGNLKMRYYGMCLQYLFNSEGVFDVTTRIIYAMTLIALGKPLPAGLSTMDWQTVRKALLELKVPADTVFEGWADGRIRNSIAHSRFTYDDATKKMRFRDIRTKRRPEYDDSFTIVEFSRICIKLDNPFHLVLNLLFIVRIMQLVLSPTVEDAGKRSIFEKWKKSPLYDEFDPVE